MEKNKKLLKEFKNILMNSLLLRNNEDIELIEYFLSNDKFLEEIFEKNFDSNIEYAKEKLLSYDIDILNSLRIKVFDELKKLNGYKKVVNTIYETLFSLKDSKKLLIITDSDTDGSVGQSIFLFLKKILPTDISEKIIIKYSEKKENTTAGHGVNFEHIKELIETEINKDEIGCILTIDNGINNKVEIDKIHKLFNNKIDILISDHHTPNETVVIENNNTIIYNPKYNPNSDNKNLIEEDFFYSHNVSGGMVSGMIAIGILEEMKKKAPKIFEKAGFNKSEYFEQVVEGISELGFFANQADIVNSLPYMFSNLSEDISRNSNLSGLINTNNNIGFLFNSKMFDTLVKTFELEKNEAEIIFFKLNKLNFLAYKIIELFEDENKKTLEPNDLIKEIINLKLNVEDNNINISDVNYLSLLRPYFINDIVLSKFSLINSYYDLLKNEMENIFKEYKNIQKELMTLIRNKAEIGINNLSNLKIEEEYSTILQTKNGIPRKFLLLTLNELVNGFKIVLDNKEGNKLSGSFRSNISHKYIFDKFAYDFFLNQLNIKVVIAGHDMAAGISFEKLDNSEITEKDLNLINKFINKKITNYNEKNNELEYYSLSYFKLFTEFNKKIGGELPGLIDKKFNIKLDKQTITNLLANGNIEYGWKVLKLDVSGTGLIIPTSILNKIKDEPDKFILQFQSFGDSFITSNLIESTNIKEKFFEKNHMISSNEKIIKYYENMEELKTEDGHVGAKIEKIDNSTLKNGVHFFKYSNQGEEDFQAVQKIIIDFLNNSKLEKYIVFDVETADGLGKGAFINNAGISALYIDPNSGIKISKEKFNKITFKTVKNDTVIVEDINNIIPITAEEKKLLSKEDKLFILKDNEGNLFFNKDRIKFSKVYNYFDNGKEIIYNQELIADNLATFIIDNGIIKNFSLAISELTHIDIKWLEKYGTDFRYVDEILFNYFSKNKFLLQAHNIMFDYTLMTQFPKTFKALNKNGIFFDSANAVKSSNNKNSTYASIEIVNSETADKLKIIFNNKTGSEDSIETFLNNLEYGEERFIVSTDKKFQLHYDGSNLYLKNMIDINIKEILIVEDVNSDNIELLEELLNLEKDVNKSEKYGVQYIDTYNLILNMLNEHLKISRSDIDLSDIEENKIYFLNNFKRMLEKYMFEVEPKVNIQNYINSIGTEAISGENTIKKLIKNNIEKKIQEGHIKLTADVKLLDLIEKEYQSYILYLEEWIKYTFLLVNNKEINEHFTLVKIMVNLLPKLPNLDLINEEQIKLLSEKEGISIDTIHYILNIIQNYENKYNIKIQDIEELHFNLINNSELTELAGDTTLESSLLFLHMIRQLNNPLNVNSDIYVKGNLEKEIIKTEQKIKKFLHLFSVNINSYSAKQLIEQFNEREENSSDLALMFADMQIDYKKSNIVLESLFLNKEAVFNINFENSDNLEEDIQKIEFLSFLQNIYNTKNKLLLQIRKILDDNKLAYIFKELQDNDSVDDYEKIYISLRKKSIKDELEIVKNDIFSSFQSNPFLLINKLLELPFDYIIKTLEKYEKNSPKGLFTTSNALKKLYSNIINLKDKTEQFLVSKNITDSTIELKNKMSNDLSKKYSIQLDTSVHKAKLDIWDKMFDLFANMHFAYVTKTHFSTSDISIQGSSNLANLSEKEQKEFADLLIFEITSVLDNLNSEIPKDLVKDIVSGIVKNTFYYDENTINNGKWLDNNKKSFNNIYNALLKNDIFKFIQLIEYYKNSYKETEYIHIEKTNT